MKKLNLKIHFFLSITLAISENLGKGLKWLSAIRT